MCCVTCVDSFHRTDAALLRQQLYCIAAHSCPKLVLSAEPLCAVIAVNVAAGQFDASPASQQQKRPKLEQQPAKQQQQQQQRLDKKPIIISSNRAAAGAPGGGHSSSSKTKFYEMLAADGVTAAAAAAAGTGAASTQAFLADLRLEREMARKLKVKKVRASTAI
jgi:hypothetical protein